MFNENFPGQICNVNQFICHITYVSDVIRDDYTGDIKEIVGEKVDRQTYEEGEAELWNGETITTLSVNDYDKIYSDDNVLEALAKCYLENNM